MGRVLNLFKSRRVIITIGFVFLVILIWLVMGWWIGLSALVCMVATCIVLVLFSAYLLWEQARAAKKASNLEKSIWEQSEDQKLGVRPEKREEIENLRRQLVSSIQQLKKSKLGHGRRGSSALYALPWYMIIGPPAAGKTTAIRNSGLEFPFGTDHEIQGVGGTRNCDWWFSNSAIVLDTAGRYTTEEEDQPEWLAFLETLKKNRRRQPINGVLICISIADLLNGGIEDIELHAKTVRKRVDELTRQLGLRFPVYLMFTKCDLFNGFVEFFGDFSRTQREQIWGCTFGRDQLDAPDPKSLFEQEFQTMYDGLLNARFTRLSPGIKREDRSLIFAFPMEFLSARDPLAYFVGKVFQPNPYQESPIFRGFYFTSGTQEGVPIDKVIHSIADAFGLPSRAKDQFSPEIQAKSYFIKDLFTDVIIPDERLVRPNSRAARSKRFLKVGTVAAAVIGLALFTLGVTQAYFRSKSEIEATGIDAQRFKAVPANPADPFPRLNILLNRINVLQDPPFFLFGMDRSQSLLTSLRLLYFREVHPIASNNFVMALQNRLINSTSTRGELYDNLKAYLLLTSDVDRLREEQANQTFLADRLSKLVDPKIAASVLPHIEYFARDFGQAVHDSLAHPFAFDARAVALARSYAGRLDVPGIYENLRRKVNSLPPYAFSSPVFLPGSQVRGVFTIEGYNNLEQLIQSGEFLNLGDEAKWVLGLRSDQVTGPVQNEAQIGDSLRMMYYREYSTEWWNYLSSLKVVPFDNLSDAATRVRTLSDPKNSPIKKLFEDVVRNTTFQASLEQGLKEKIEKKLGGSGGSANYVEQQFKDFQAFVAGDQAKGKQAELDGLLAQLGQVSDELDALNSGTPKDARVHAGNVYSGSGPLAQALREIRRSEKGKDENARRAMVNLLEQPILFSWKAVLGKTIDYLNDQWAREVVEPYRQLANYYPFDNNGQDAPLNEVAAVFADNGKLWKFVDNELRAFVDEDQGWDQKPWEGGEGLALSPAARTGLAQAKALNLSLFKGTDAKMKVDVKLESLVKPDGAPDVDKIYLSIGGKEQCWDLEDNKRATFSFDWPGDAGAKIRLVRVGSKFLVFGSKEDVVDEKSFDGGWGLFRLAAASNKVGGTNRAEVHCRWTFKNGIAVLCVLKTDKGFNNPLSKSLRVDLPQKLN